MKLHGPDSVREFLGSDAMALLFIRCHDRRDCHSLADDIHGLDNAIVLEVSQNTIVLESPDGERLSERIRHDTRISSVELIG